MSKAALSACASQRSRLMLVMLALVCLLPVVAAYFFYYVAKPTGGRGNYGHLIVPQRAVPVGLEVIDASGQRMPLAEVAALRGKWWLVSADDVLPCDDQCHLKRFYMKQLRVAQGAERDRIKSLWIQAPSGALASQQRAALQPVGDDGDPDAVTFSVAPDVLPLLRAWLSPDRPEAIGAGLYLVDPNGHLMMRFPHNPDAAAMRRDLAKLLKWSGLG